jgi:PAS domain S-box-containing protein
MSDRVERGAADPQSAVYERITDAVIALDSGWQVTFLDDRAESYLGVSKEEVLGRTVGAVLPELADSTFEAQCAEAFDTGTPTQFVQPSPATDEMLAVRIYPSESGVTVCFREPDDLDVDDAGLRQAVVTETITDAAVTIDDEGIIRHANSATEDLFGYTAAELVGEPLTTLVPERLRARHEAGLERYVETGEQQMDWRDIEMPGLRKDGTEVELSISFTAHETADGTCLTGIMRDITERKRRAGALRRAYEVVSDGDLDFDGKVEALLEVGCDAIGMEYGARSQIQGEDYLFETVVNHGEAAFDDGDTADLGATNCERVAETTETLVLGDIERDAPELVDRRINAEWGMGCYLGAPVVIDGEVTGTVCFADAEPRTRGFSEWQVAFVEYLSQWVSKETERRRYIDRLTALNELNLVEREITDAVIDQSTREDIEERVCEALAATDSYLFAWIGEADPQTQAVELRAEAGVDDYLDDVTISVDPEVPESGGPTGRAIRTGELQTVQRVTDDESYRPWRDTAEEYGYRSSAAVPVVHEGSEYGVLNLYTDRRDGFEGEERDVVELLGKLVGHAIAAAERKQALLSESVVELELRVNDAISEYDVPEFPEENVVLDTAIPRRGNEYVLFGNADPDDRAFVKALPETQSSWEEFLNATEHDEEFSFEVLLHESPILSLLASVGGRLERAVIDGQDLHMRVQLPHSADVRKTLDAVREAYPSTTLVSKQKTTPSRTADPGRAQVALSELTDRQWETLRTAYHAGYFDWPRDSSGEEVADMLGITAATFSQHLRGAEQAVFRSLLGEETG